MIIYHQMQPKLTASELNYSNEYTDKNAVTSVLSLNYYVSLLTVLEFGLWTLVLEEAILTLDLIEIHLPMTFHFDSTVAIVKLIFLL